MNIAFGVSIGASTVFRRIFDRVYTHAEIFTHTQGCAIAPNYPLYVCNVIKAVVLGHTFFLFLAESPAAYTTSAT